VSTRVEKSCVGHHFKLKKSKYVNCDKVRIVQKHNQIGEFSTGDYFFSGFGALWQKLGKKDPFLKLGEENKNEKEKVI